MTKQFRIVTLPGDGIGPEITAEAVKVVRAIEQIYDGLTFEIEERQAGARCYLDCGSPLPDATWAACRTADAIFLGAMGLPDVRRADGTEIAPQLDLRRGLDLFAGVRPVVLFHEDHTPLKGYGRGAIDFVIIRESTEGLFASRDAGVTAGDAVAVDNLVITRRSTERTVRYACELAEARAQKRRVTCVDKANVFRTYAFFRAIFDDVTATFPAIKADHAYVDAAALYLVNRPETFDVIVTENMFGDILSDLAAGLVGGMGMAPSADIGRDHAVFQPAHGSAPDLAGRNMANPIAAILSVSMMLRHLGAAHALPELREASAAVHRAVEALFAATPRTTVDLGGAMTCAEVGTAICEHLAKGA